MRVCTSEYSQAGSNKARQSKLKTHMGTVDDSKKSYWRNTFQTCILVGSGGPNGDRGHLIQNQIHPPNDKRYGTIHRARSNRWKIVDIRRDAETREASHDTLLKPSSQWSPIRCRRDDSKTWWTHKLEIHEQALNKVARLVHYNRDHCIWFILLKKPTRCKIATFVQSIAVKKIYA